MLPHEGDAGTCGRPPAATSIERYVPGSIATICAPPVQIHVTTHQSAQIGIPLGFLLRGLYDTHSRWVYVGAGVLVRV